MVCVECLFFFSLFSDVVWIPAVNWAGDVGRLRTDSYPVLCDGSSRGAPCWPRNHSRTWWSRHHFGASPSACMARSRSVLLFVCRFAARRWRDLQSTQREIHSMSGNPLLGFDSRTSICQTHRPETLPQARSEWLGVLRPTYTGPFSFSLALVLLLWIR